MSFKAEGAFNLNCCYFEAGNGTAYEERVAESPEYAFNEYLQICAEQGKRLRVPVLYFFMIQIHKLVCRLLILNDTIIHFLNLTPQR